MFFNFVPIYLDRQFLLNEAQIGLVLGAFGFSMAITHIPAGHLADRIGRKPLLITAWLLGLVSTLIMGIALTLPLFLVGLFGYGLTAFVSSPLSSYMTAARGDLPVGTILSLSTATFGYGHGAWACNRRLDRRSLRYACEFFGGFRCIPALEHLHVFHREVSHWITTILPLLHLISITTGSWLSYLA